MELQSLASGARTRTSRGPRIGKRAAVAALAIGAALAVYAVAKLAGADVETVRRSELAVDLPALYVVIVGAVFAVLGWASLVVLERWYPRRARFIWTFVGKLVFISAVLHSALESKLDGGQRVVLVLMTVAYAVVLVGGLLITSPAPPMRRSRAA